MVVDCDLSQLGVTLTAGDMNKHSERRCTQGLNVTPDLCQHLCLHEEGRSDMAQLRRAQQVRASDDLTTI